jgi:hypothetical protein
MKSVVSSAADTIASKFVPLNPNTVDAVAAFSANNA